MPDTAPSPQQRSARRHPRGGRRAWPADRSRRYSRLYRGLAASLSRQHPGGDSPRQHRGTGRRGPPVRRGACADRAAGRQHVDGRRCHAVGGRQRIRAEPVPHDAHPRHRSDRPDHDHRSRRHAEGGTDCRGRCGVPAAAVDLVGGHRADRRRSRRQRRRQQHRALRQRARPGARAGGGAAGRLGVERPAPAAQGQHRLLPAPALRRLGGNARHHHRRGAETRAAAARDLRGVLRDRLLRTRRWNCSAGSRRTTTRPCRRSNTCPGRGSTSC